MDAVYNIPDGFQTYGANLISYVSSDGAKLYVNQPVLRIMVTEENDLSDLPADVPIGSEAFTADESKKWRLDASGTWQEIGAVQDQQNDG